jgi:hypothetical protein
MTNVNFRKKSSSAVYFKKIFFNGWGSLFSAGEASRIYHTPVRQFTTHMLSRLFYIFILHQTVAELPSHDLNRLFDPNDLAFSTWESLLYLMNFAEILEELSEYRNEITKNTYADYKSFCYFVVVFVVVFSQLVYTVF